VRFLITGITGFTGRHVAALLLAEGSEVFGTTRGQGALAPVHLPPNHVSVVTLEDAAGLAEVVRRVRPEGVFHLAALTSVPLSFANPEETYRSNLLGSLNVFAAVRAAAGGCRIVWVGSSHAYGYASGAELPVTEAAAFRPLSPYAVSKAAADLAAYQWSRAHGLDVVRVRPFNHTGPGQAPHFVCADFARQVVEIERGMRTPVVHAGDLDVVRDFSDVRDVVRAYMAAWQSGQQGEAYNVCSGVGRTPRQILDTIVHLAGVQAAVAVDAGRQRPDDVRSLIGSAAKLRAATGWSPAISWEQTLRDVLDDWRARLGATD
jgi:GDP-4-dehydro-6-deoxy-D-mannose reductase